MTDSVLLGFQFWFLVFVSLVVASVILGMAIRKQKLKRATVLFLGLFLILLAGMDVILLRQLEARARETTDLLDDAFFLSEYSLALYVLPLVSAAVGTNLLSHVITSRLVISEHLAGQ